jgi:branched-chain amino acid transport system substrate-binding protein
VRVLTRRWVAPAVLLALTVAVPGWWWLERRVAMVTVAISVDLPIIYGAAINPSDDNTAEMYIAETPSTRITLDRLFVDPDPARAAPDIQAAIARGVRFFVLTHASSHAIPSRHLFDDGRALGIHVGATSVALSGRDDYLLRVIPDFRTEQLAMAEFVADTARGARLLVLQDTGNVAYTDPAFAVFHEHLERLADWEVTRHRLDVATFDPISLRAEIDGEFDALYILAGAFLAPIGNIAQLFHHMAPDAPIYLTPWADSQVIYQNAGEALGQVRMLRIHPPRGESASVDGFFARFEQRFGHEPQGMSLGTRQALELLDQAFAAGHVTPDAVKHYLLSIPQHETTLGPVRLDRYGDVVGDHYRVLRIPGGGDVP